MYLQTYISIVSTLRLKKLESIFKNWIFAGKGPGYASPLDAFHNGPREELLYVICVQPDKTKQDYVATVDVNPESSTYSQVKYLTLKFLLTGTFYYFKAVH